MSLTPFDELITAERSPVFTLSSINNLSMLRNVTTGTPTHTGEEYLLEAGDRLETAEIGNYVPGFAAEAGIGIRVATLPTGSQVMRWGYYDDEDGFGWKLDTSGLSTFIRRDSVDIDTAQADWNADTVTGTTREYGDSNLNLDLAAGNIYQLPFTWYGFGQVVWSIVDTRPGKPQTIIPLHRYQPDGDTSVRTPNLPITAEVTGAGSGQLYVAGRQFSILGRYTPQQRTHGILRTLTGIGTSFTPVIAFRRQDNDNAKRIRMLVESLSLKGTADCQIGIVVNPTVTFGTAVAPDLASTGQTAVEFTINPSGYSLGTGEAIVTDLVPTSGTGNNTSGANRWDGLNVPIARRQPVVLVVRALTGTVDVTAVLKSLEEW